LVNFGQESYKKLTKEEKQHILKYSKQSMANLIKYLHINDRMPEYKNVCVKNLRGKGGYLYEGNKWMHLNYNILLMILFKNKINDLDKILAEHENLNISSSKNIQDLIDNYTDDMDTFIKNNKENIINMLYNHTKNYKIE
jgi:glutaredoxin-related protein